jgi:hypothetical protein
VRSAPCTWRRGAQVSWLSLKTKVDGFSVIWPQNHWDSLSVVWPQNHWDGFPVWPQNHWDGFPVWPQNQWQRFRPVWHQNRSRRVFRFGSQNWQLQFGNQAGYGLSIAPQNRREDGVSAGHASRSSSLLRVEAS